MFSLTEYMVGKSTFRPTLYDIWMPLKYSYFSLIIGMHPSEQTRKDQKINLAKNKNETCLGSKQESWKYFMDSLAQILILEIK